MDNPPAVPADGQRYRSGVGTRFGFVSSFTSVSRMLDADLSGRILRFDFIRRREDLLISLRWSRHSFRSIDWQRMAHLLTWPARR
ncbi:hypothetical protein [Rhodopirellula sp. SWK7]|uniref:hypothetical protein n=1 Tax=Rhodopirellula sp. SWK7 TaxID=595460 RepID=UPI0002BE1FDB|nr:hypothetical protein [Rhodopirellula sp. SWK7]EMI42307.1 hypothetical protein RRSWK_05150 [Rhodopirellula sp. SWK7]